MTRVQPCQTDVIVGSLTATQDRTRASMLTAYGRDRKPQDLNLECRLTRVKMRIMVYELGASNNPIS
jgi:hypothetical protein